MVTRQSIIYASPNLTCARQCETMVITSSTHQLKLPAPESADAGWIPYHLFSGSTGTHALISSHFSVLSPGCCPHLPHAHPEEELLIILEGQAEVLTATSPDDINAVVHTLQTGKFSYYPAFQHHTIRNVSSEPVTYLMFKWRGAVPGFLAGAIVNLFSKIRYRELLQLMVHDIGSVLDLPAEGFTTHMVFEGETSNLSKLHCHLTRLSPGAGYDAHADDHDVAIVLLDGNVRVNGYQFEKAAVIYYSAGELHDMQNIGDDTATYLVFEFHRR